MNLQSSRYQLGALPLSYFSIYMFSVGVIDSIFIYELCVEPQPVLRYHARSIGHFGHASPFSILLGYSPRKHIMCLHKESNLEQAIRSRLLYPFNYRGIVLSEGIEPSSSRSKRDILSIKIKEQCEPTWIRTMDTLLKRQVL